jgi:hypothetical protein
MYAATIESTNKNVAVFTKPASKGGDESTKLTDNKILKMELKDPDEWKDSLDRTHKKHQMAFAACKSMYVMMRKVLDHYREESQGGNDKATNKEIRL